MAGLEALPHPAPAAALSENARTSFRHRSIYESSEYDEEGSSLSFPANSVSGSLTASSGLIDDDGLGEKPQIAYNPPPNGGYGWVVVACSFLLEFFAEGPISAFGVFQEYYVNEQFKGHASNATISLVGVLNGSCMSVLGVVSGKLCERYGYRIVPMCGIIILSLGYLLASFATEGVLCGVGTALTFMPALVVPAQWFDRRRGLATGIVNMGIGVGGIVWTQFNHMLIRKISVAWTLRLTSAVVLIACVDALPVFVGLYYTLAGVGYLFGPPVAGVILEKTKSWGPPYLALKIYTGLPMVIACADSIMKIRVVLAVLGMLHLAMGSVWPIPAVYTNGTANTAAYNAHITAWYTTSATLNAAVRRYNLIIDNEAFTPPADYNKEAPNPEGNLMGLSVSVDNGDETLSLDTDESYTLDVPTSGVAKLKANTVYGALRGMETYSQLLVYNGGFRYIKNTPIHIEDRPTLKHRGVLLDTARNYYPVSDIKRTLDAMSFNKLNIFHWHIVDSQSWPVESKMFPELQSKGAYSANMRYSYEDVQDIVEYAQVRGIRVIPEFDMPGHTYAVGLSKPELMSCLNKQPGWDKFAAEPPSGQLNIAKPAATEFALDIVNEYAQLFPDNVFHLGGDEVNLSCWKEDPDVKEYLEANPEESVESLLVGFYDKVHSIVENLNRTGMTWEETLFHTNYTPPKSTIIQAWIDEASVAKTVAKGYRSIASPASAYYLDCGHGAWLSNVDGNSWCDPFKTWMHIYNFDPMANITDSEQRKLVIGAEVALWSEQSDPAVLDARLWPRAAAMAETSWSGKTDASGRVRTTKDAAARLHNQRFRMLKRGIMAEPLQPLWCARHPGGGSPGSGIGSNSGSNGSSSNSANTGLDSMSDEQKRVLRRKIEALKAIELEVEQLKEDRIEQSTRRLGIHKIASMNVLSLFGRNSDWRPLASNATERFGAGPAPLTWDMLKKAVAEEDKYQSKKNWSSTKGRGNRKAPIARRLDAESIKKFGVYPMQQYPTLAICDSCGRQVNAHFLKEHQETVCVVPAAKREDKRAAAAAKVKEREETPVAVKDGAKRLASEALSEEGDGRAPKVSKRELARLEKEQREKERADRREQLRVDKERRKREKDEKKERELAQARTALDLDKQCGVLSTEPDAQPCTRSLTCKTHSMAMKRSVRGRSKLFDALLQAHLAKSRSIAAMKNAASNGAAAKSSSAAAVRNATAIALGGEAGALDESFFEEESDQDRDSDSEAELVIAGIRCSRGRPMAVRPTLLPRRRHHYLRVRDLFYDALKPSMGGEPADALAS
ncbi:Glucosamine-6-phosphate isomerase (Glucosamine-6-phosphate deaminase) (GNPDA) (GlcN6P deaminase) [Coemansia sp. BCRC 34301]|nr:Glucosamine-6-phosphate isomerase (Glucosamine-6-phosphate deaminase) (GNPDA) (GlcN6P deaminase) [Coemansia sp. BCRC 34301]